MKVISQQAFNPCVSLNLWQFHSTSHTIYNVQYIKVTLQESILCVQYKTDTNFGAGIVTAYSIQE